MVSDNAKAVTGWVALAAAVVLGLVGVIALAMYIKPVYNVWAAGKAGEAKLRQAESEKRILVEQAAAEKEAAQERAEAIRIIGEAAKEFPEYRQQEFIGAFAEAMQDGTIQKIIYVPTEACIPITEAGRTRQE